MKNAFAANNTLGHCVHNYKCFINSGLFISELKDSIRISRPVLIRSDYVDQLVILLKNNYCLDIISIQDVAIRLTSMIMLSILVLACIRQEETLLSSSQTFEFFRLLINLVTCFFLSHPDLDPKTTQVVYMTSPSSTDIN